MDNPGISKDVNICWSNGRVYNPRISMDVLVHSPVVSWIIYGCPKIKVVAHLNIQS